MQNGISSGRQGEAKLPTYVSNLKVAGAQSHIQPTINYDCISREFGDVPLINVDS